MKKKLFLNFLVLASLAFNFIFWFAPAAADSSLTLADKLQQVLDTELARHHGIGVSAISLLGTMHINPRKHGCNFLDF